MTNEFMEINNRRDDETPCSQCSVNFNSDPSSSTVNISRRVQERSHGTRSRRRTARRSQRHGYHSSPEEEAQQVQVGQWPHNLSFLFASLSCTLGFFSISRFSLLTMDFGLIFILQFLLLSLIFGIPLLAFHVSLGQYLGSGVIDMWRISPIFQGIGVSLMLSQGLFSFNGIVSISWMFIYFRDSSVTTYDSYRWSLCNHDYAYRRSCVNNFFNNTGSLEQTIPDYFAGTVLHRSTPNYPNDTLGHIKFQTVFNLAVIWMIVFMCLSKGLKSYGKVVYIFGLVPILLFLIFSTKVLGILPFSVFRSWLAKTQWTQFIYNVTSWLCAAREVFFTWSLLGASLMQLSSHNKFKHKLIRDTSIIVILTLIVMITAGLLGITTSEVIRRSGYDYEVSSFETYKSYEFLSLRQNKNSHSRTSFEDSRTSALKFISPSEKEHISFISGIRIIQPGRDPDRYSGYQVMRLITEIIPTTASLLGPRLFSPFWTVLFYFSMILFGIGQQLALWYTVVSGIIAIKPECLKNWETCITFSCSIFGFIIAFPLATESGVFILYFLDYVLGSGWWIMLLYAAQLFSIFIIRSRPYSAENVASILFSSKSKYCCTCSCYGCVVRLLSLNWTLLLPLSLLSLTVVSFKAGRFGEMFDWNVDSGYFYFPSWVREIGAMMQLIPLLLLPFVAIITTCRHFLYGPQDFYDKINLLYRPRYRGHSHGRNDAREGTQDFPVINVSSTISSNDDPPPKYTPPPSYSTATGARIARFLRQSIRQNIRRFTLEFENRKVEEESFSSPPVYDTALSERQRSSSDEYSYSSSSFIIENDELVHHYTPFENSNTSTSSSSTNLGEARRNPSFEEDDSLPDGISVKETIVLEDVDTSASVI